MPNTIPTAVMDSVARRGAVEAVVDGDAARHLHRTRRSRHRGDPGDDRRRRVARRSGGHLGTERPGLDRRRARRAVRRGGARAGQHPMEGRRSGVPCCRPPTSRCCVTTVGFLDTDTVAMLDDDPTELPDLRSIVLLDGSAEPQGRASVPGTRCTSFVRSLGRVRRGRGAGHRGGGVGAAAFGASRPTPATRCSRPARPAGRRAS